MNSKWFVTGAIMAAVGVAIGAFGAHGLKTSVSADLLAVFEIGVRYHMYHALALLLVGLAETRCSARLLNVAGYLFVLGIVFFSGSLYLMTLSGARWLGAITPIGGICFIGAWIVLAVAAYRRTKSL